MSGKDSRPSRPLLFPLRFSPFKSRKEKGNGRY